jgi:hypothetical protein
MMRPESIRQNREVIEALSFQKNGGKFLTFRALLRELQESDNAPTFTAE